MRSWIAVLCLVVLSSCGFQLRGAYTLPFDSVYIALPEGNALRAVLKRNIVAGTQAKVVDDAKSAQATLQVLGDLAQKNILSIGSDGRVREYQLVRRFTFRVQDREVRDLVPTSVVTIQRDITFSDSAVLSKEAEEGLLWRDIETDLVQQILRRLAAAKVQASAE